MATAVFSIAGSEFQAEAVLNELRVARFPEMDISVLLPDKARANVARRQKTPTSGVSGGTLGWLAGIQAIPIPGAGAFIANGPLVAALSGSAVEGSRRGIASALSGMGLSEADARSLDQMVRGGGILLVVHSETVENAKHARAIFEQAGTQEIAVSGEIEMPSCPPDVQDEKREQTDGSFGLLD